MSWSQLYLTEVHIFQLQGIHLNALFTNNNGGIGEKSDNNTCIFVLETRFSMLVSIGQFLTTSYSWNTKIAFRELVERTLTLLCALIHCIRNPALVFIL